MSTNRKHGKGIVGILTVGLQIGLRPLVLKGVTEAQIVCSKTALFLPVSEQASSPLLHVHHGFAGDPL